MNEYIFSLYKPKISANSAAIMDEDNHFSIIFGM